MGSTPPLAGPGPDTGAAGAGVLGEPLIRRRSRLRIWLLLEAGAVTLGYTVAVLRDGAPATGGAWALVAAGAVAVAVPLWVKSRRELRQEIDTRSAETLAIETDAKLRLIVGDVVTPIAEVVGRVHQTSGKGERESLRGQLKQLVVEAAANLCDGERARAVFCGQQNLGMLSVDAPEPHAFDDTDLNVMRAMAQLLGAGLVDRR